MTRILRCLVAPALVALSGCGGGTPTSPATPITPTAPPVVTTTGTLGLSVTGLPTGVNAALTISGPNAYTSTATATADLTALTPGAYTVTANAVTSSGTSYTATPATQQVTVAANARATAAVAYAAGAASARIIVSVTGLPTGTKPNVVVTGPNAYTDTLSAAVDTLPNLAAGSYTLTAGTAMSGTMSYTPTPATQTLSVTTGQNASTSIAYAAAGAVSLNLTVDAAYLVQTTQTLTGAVPLVANKAAWIRVFARATEGNTVRPDVRVRLYNGSTVVQTSIIPAPSTSVPMTVDESSLTKSWNVAVPANLMQNGLRILVDVDPTNAIPEANETDNSFPSNGTPMALTVRTIPTFALRLIPVITRSNSLQGDVSASTASSYTTILKAVWPVVNVDVDVRAAYTTTDTASLTSSNSNGTWGDILSEIYALRRADSSSRDYYGVVGTTYTSGVAGIGYVGAPAAIGWDKSGSRASVAAHELGHNFGRSHAPCGSVANPDPNYPYAGGTIGVYGFDVDKANTSGINAVGVLKQTSSTDLMGYCSTQWVSDYNYSAVVSFFTGAATISAALNAVQPSLIVWGTIRNGQVTLQPAFEARTRPVMPSGRGAQVLEGLDASGNQLFSWAFDGDIVADDADGTRHFTFALPLDNQRRAQLATLRVRSGGSIAEQRAGVVSAAAGGSRTLRTVAGNGGGVAVTWDAVSYPLAVVRDAVSGEILSLARGGSVNVVAPSGRVRVDVSDGVRSTVVDVQ